MKNPKVFIIILNWNGLEDTLECLESVFKLDYTNFEVIVVDNGSTDNSVDVIRQTYPHVILIENRENLGYAGGNNIGIKYALKHGADYLWLLNNDTTVNSDSLTALVEVAEKDKDIGILGSKIFYYNKRDILWFAGSYIDWNKAISPHIGMGQKDIGQYNIITEVDRVTGCSMLVKREVCCSVGLFDPDFFLYVEEVDWCVRAKKAGFKCVFVPNSIVYHKVSSTLKNVSYNHSLSFIYYNTRNFLYLIKKNFSFPKREKLIIKIIYSKLKYNKHNILKLLLSTFLDVKIDIYDLPVLLAIKDFLLNKKGKSNYKF